MKLISKILILAATVLSSQSMQATTKGAIA